VFREKDRVCCGFVVEKISSVYTSVLVMQSPEAVPQDVLSILETLNHFFCPRCKQPMAIGLVSAPPTEAYLTEGKRLYIDETGKRQILILAALECPSCHTILPAPGIDPQ